ncbi:MAG: hypothetical protein U0359_33630 [Byssovorax sp.]
MTTPVQLISGLGGAIGSDYRQSRSQLDFVEYGGKVSRLNLVRRVIAVASQGSAVIQGTYAFDFDLGVSPTTLSATTDVFWHQKTSTSRSLDPQNGAKIVNLGVVDWSSVNHVTLQNLTYGSAPINGNADATNELVTGDVFAVLTQGGNYAKVRVTAYGYDLHIEWVTYQLAPRYEVLGTGYNAPEDIRVTSGEKLAYVTERSGNLLRVNLLSANRTAATVVAGGLTAPHQIALDEAHNQAYVVEYAAAGRLLRIDLTSGVSTAIVSNLDHAVGLLITSDLAFAYVSEQTTGPDGGRVSKIALNTGARTTVAAHLTSPFMLSWFDASESAILVPERDPANRVSLINLSAVPATVTPVATGLPVRPSSAAVTIPGQILVCSNDEIDRVDLAGISTSVSGLLFLGIGHVPADKINPTTGRATTDPGYFFQVTDVPFGGTLPLLVNHQKAWLDGARYYRVVVDGTAKLDTYADYKVNPSTNASSLVTVAPTTVGTAGGGFYPVHPPQDLFLWQHPSLGDMLSTTGLSNGLHNIRIDFFNAAGGFIESSVTTRVLIDNNHCSATIALPTLNGNTANPMCGTMNYGQDTTGTVVMGYTATHPTGNATFSFTLLKGVNALTLPGVTHGSVNAVTPPLSVSDTVAHLLGSCTIAGFAEYVYCAATAIDGWSRLSQYDASAAIAFVLAP